MAAIPKLVSQPLFIGGGRSKNGHEGAALEDFLRPVLRSHPPTKKPGEKSGRTVERSPAESLLYAGPQDTEADSQTREAESQTDEADMTDHTQELVDAKLAAAEARTETRIEKLGGAIEVRFVGLDHKIDRLVDTVSVLSRTVGEVRDDNKRTRNTVIGVVVASVLAGLAALWITQSNLLAAFQSGISVKMEQPSSTPAVTTPGTKKNNP